MDLEKWHSNFTPQGAKKCPCKKAVKMIMLQTTL